MKRIACRYNVKDHRCIFENQGIEEFAKEGKRGAIYGRMIIDGRINCRDAIISEARRDSRLQEQRYGGMYILMLYDENEKVLRVFQDFFGAPVPVYYAQKDQWLYVDSSLKHLLARVGLRPCMNDGAVKQFVRYGAVFGEETLLEGIRKIAPFRALEVEDGPVQYPVRYHAPQMSCNQAKADWEKTLQENICRCVQPNEQISMPISGGYDSNYILWTLNENTDRTLRVFSLGAEKGISELEVVRDNISCYPRAMLTTGLTSRDTLAHMDDIVWRLEGAVYEAGIFLQYELGRMLHQAGSRLAVCGECADQVMNRDFQINQAHVPLAPQAPVNQDPYAYGSAIVVKKSGIMLNSFDVEGRYPYIDLPFYGICRGMAAVNGRDKLYHKRVCAKRLPERVLRHISKVGGSTSLHSLFRDRQEIEAFFNYVEETQAFRMYAGQTNACRQSAPGGGLWKRIRRFVRAEPNARLLLSKIVSKMRVSRTQNYSPAFRQEERKLNEYMKIYYLEAFRQMFCTDFCADMTQSTRDPSTPWVRDG